VLVPFEPGEPMPDVHLDKHGTACDEDDEAE
jgi:hypothetical protein